MYNSPKSSTHATGSRLEADLSVSSCVSRLSRDRRPLLGFQNLLLLLVVVVANRVYVSMNKFKDLLKYAVTWADRMKRFYQPDVHSPCIS